MDSPFYAFIVNSPLTTLLVYEPFQKEMDKKNGASANRLRESLRKGTFGINKSFSQDILYGKWLCICIRGEMNSVKQKHITCQEKEQGNSLCDR